MKLQNMNEDQLKAYGLELFDSGSGEPARLGLWRFEGEGSKAATLFYDLDREEIKAINKLLKKGYSDEEIRDQIAQWADELMWEDDLERGPS